MTEPLLSSQRGSWISGCERGDFSVITALIKCLVRPGHIVTFFTEYLFYIYRNLKSIGFRKSLEHFHRYCLEKKHHQASSDSRCKIVWLHSDQLARFKG